MLLPFRGSSPLARGLPLCQRREHSGTRIIPARAGFTDRDSGTRCRGQDHPRSRGVYAASERGESRYGGSSPLARGLPGEPGFAALTRGIIPARAGFTARTPSGWHCAPGSSPLARGLHAGATHLVTVVRIIPARAGFTGHTGHRSGAAQDHPRSRGVYTPGLKTSTCRHGSSPLARGLLDPPLDALATLGIIPARAGFTCWRAPRRPSPTDHPRSRGVYAHTRVIGTAREGSSPLARGLPLNVRVPGGSLGIIPARAGFTHTEDPPSRLSRDHPRSRGVYALDAKTAADVAGSSPLARGLLFELSGPPLPVGIIPARAGFTVTASEMT